MAINKDTGREDPVVVLGLVLFVPVLLFLLMWLVGSHKIVAASAPAAYQIGKLWLLPVFPRGQEMMSRLAQGGTEFMAAPSKVTLGDWFIYMNLAMEPLAWFLATLILCTALPMAIFSKRQSLFRRFSPTQLMGELSKVFTGVVPMMHLRLKLVRDELPLWRRQTFPHEFLQTEKTFDGRLLVLDGMIQLEALKDRLIGIDPKKAIGGRPYSLTLGRLLVHLVHDRENFKSINFPDRMSDIGKVIFALLVAHAFGGREGIQDYRKAVDQLNRSCAGEANGRANLSVAQWIYTKYRSNAQAHNLFAVHHWEYTYLVELLSRAKKQGKCGHTSFMWLKPMNRQLFYALNQVGRWVPHAESAAAFDHHAAERLAAKNGLVFIKQHEGKWVPTVWVGCALEGFVAEWERWCNGTDDGDDPWTSDRQWRLLSRLELRAPPVPEGELADQISKGTSFDSQQVAARQEEAKRTQEREQAAVRKEFMGADDLQMM